MGTEQGDDLVVRERLGDAALAADDAFGAPQRVEDGLLGRVDGRGEERVEGAIGHRARVPGGREGNEDLAAAVVRDGARACVPQQRRRRRLGARGDGPVAVIDVDAHHGNGTQAIFCDDPSVLVGSVHVDPGAGWFPHFLGFEGEAGARAGDGANRNLVLAPGTGDDGWLAAVRDLAEWARTGRALVVAPGVDAAGGDPESPLEVTAAGFRAAGRALEPWACPPSSSRRAVTTSTRSERWCTSS